MKKEKGKRFDGRSRVPNEAYKNGWKDTGTQKYRIKHGPNKGKVLG